MIVLDKISVEYGWDWRAHCWVGVVRGRAGAAAYSMTMLRFMLRMKLGTSMPAEAAFTMKLTGPDKPRPR